MKALKLALAIFVVRGSEDYLLSSMMKEKWLDVLSDKKCWPLNP